MAAQDDVKARGGTPEAPLPVTPDLLRAWPLPESGGTKYARGQVLVVGGSCTTPGAVILAGVAALRMGAGRLTVATAEGVATQVAVALPECGTLPLPQHDDGSITGEAAESLLEDELGRSDAVVLGPGLRGGVGAVRLVDAIASSTPGDVPVVLDAAALAALPDAAEPSIERLGGRLVLTPNPGELASLLRVDEVLEEDLAGASLDVADRFHAVVGCGPFIAAGGGVWSVSTGDTGLGTSGSGDVVAGAVTGLLARGASPVQATAWAKHVHAAAGDVLSARWGRVGYLATEMLPELPLVLRSLGGD
jgi:hydroxyethylthiazole kinase-like uncharacterized protein yjeF